MTASREDTVKIDSCGKKAQRFVLRYAISNPTIYDLSWNFRLRLSVFRRVNEYSDGRVAGRDSNINRLSRVARGPQWNPFDLMNNENYFPSYIVHLVWYKGSTITGKKDSQLNIESIRSKRSFLVIKPWRSWSTVDLFQH